MWSDGLISIAAFSAFLLIFYGPWQNTWTDHARYQIFVQRKVLFNMAYNGELDYESYQYKTVRSGLNAYIRYAHELTWPALLFGSIFGQKTSKPNSMEISVFAAIASIEDEATRAKLRTIVDQSTVSLIIMMAFKSILLSPLMIVFAFVMLCSTTVSAMVNKFKYIDAVAVKIFRSAKASDDNASSGAVSA